MKQIILLIAFTLSISVVSQDYRFGKVEEADFQRLVSENEEEPSAEVLLRKVKISFDYSQAKGSFLQRRYVQERIKINSEKGLEQATKHVKLYNRNTRNEERLRYLKGNTYYLNEGKILDSKLLNQGEFEEEINEYWKLSSFTMPDVQVGSIIEYEYTVESPFMTIDDVILQYDIPIKKLDVSIEMIKYFTYNLYFNPRSSYVPDLSGSVDTDKIKTTSSEVSSASFSNGKSNKFYSQQYELNNGILSIDTKDIPALEVEPMSGKTSNYRAKIVFEMAAVQYPTEPIKRMSLDWQAVTKTIYDNNDFGGQLEKKTFYEEELEASLKGMISFEDKVKGVYSFVKERVKWNGYYGIFAQKGIKDAYRDGSGNVADVNLLLISMLNSQGIQAYPLLLSTVDNGIPLFPTREGFNYIAVVVRVNNKEVFIDGTDDNLPIGTLPLRATNWQGRIVKEGGTSFWIDVMPKGQSSEISISNVVLNDDFTITGTAAKRLTNYRAYNFRDEYGNRLNEEIVGYLKDDSPGLDISNLKLNNVRKLDEPIDLSYDIYLKSAVEKIGDKIYLTPLLNEYTSENPFKLENRKLPIFIGYSQSTKTIVNLSVPKDYKVVSLPESVRYNYNEGKGNYSFVVSQLGNKLIIAADFVMNDLEVLPTDYQKWKEFYTAMVAKESEKIVLKKI
jgi:transglutaminase-like putative cysteine protease